jgi:hypothetical protein
MLPEAIPTSGVSKNKKPNFFSNPVGGFVTKALDFVHFIKTIYFSLWINHNFETSSACWPNATLSARSRICNEWGMKNKVFILFCSSSRRGDPSLHGTQDDREAKSLRLSLDAASEPPQTALLSLPQFLRYQSTLISCEE